MKPIDNVEILLVEDDANDAELALRALRRAGFSPKSYHVRDGVEALDFLRCAGAFAERSPLPFPRVVLVDIKLPRLNGLDLVRALKNDETTRSIPLVMLTSSNQRRDITEAYVLGANGFVTKPLDSDDFARAVAAIGSFWLQLNEVG